MVAYGSRTLNRAERNYCVTDRELLAVRVFIEYYKHYLLGRHSTVRSDHQALRWLFTLREPKDRVARWIEILSAYDFSVEYRPGIRHGNADALSRYADPRTCTCEDVPGVPPCGPCPKCKRRSAAGEDPPPKGELDVCRVTTRAAARAQSSETTGNSSEREHTTTKDHGEDASSAAVVAPSQAPGLRQTELGQSRGSAGADTSGPKVPTSTEPARLSSAESNLEQHSRPPGLRGRHLEWRNTHSAAELRKKQTADPDIFPVLQWLAKKEPPTSQEVARSSPATRHYWIQRAILQTEDGILYRKFICKDATWQSWQFVVPTVMRKEIMALNHDCPVAGHLGQKKTRARLLQGFYWFGARTDVNNWVMQCHTCGQVKPPAHPQHKAIGQMPVGGPLDRLATDVLGPLPETKRGNRYILVVTDHFTKWVEIFPIPDQTAPTCAGLILNEVIARFGCPYDTHSDQGRNYESHIFQELCRLLEVRKTRTSVCNPRCNGQAERFNRTLMRMVKAYLKGEQTEWDKNLGCLAAAYRATPNESTGLSPNLLMLGREVRLPAEVMFGSGTALPGESVTSYGEYVDHLRDRMQRAHEVARDHLKHRAHRLDQNADARQPFHQYAVGDLAWYLTEMGQMGMAPKLRVPYKGPVLVLHQPTPLNYVIQLDEAGTKRLIRHDKLKPYEGEEVLPWAKTALTKSKKQRYHNQGSSEATPNMGCQREGALVCRRVFANMPGVPSAMSQCHSAGYRDLFHHDVSTLSPCRYWWRMEEAKKSLESRGRVLECKDCGQFRGDKRQMETHCLHDHTSEDQVPFECGACGNRYPKLSSLNSHLKRAHKGHDKKNMAKGTGEDWRLKRRWYTTLSEEASLAHY